VAGPWAAIKKLRNGPPKKPIQIRDAQGKLVDSSHRGDTLADYFEKVQWKVSFADVHPTGEEDMGPTLPVRTTQFTHEELTAALKTLALEKAAGCDKIPPEFWKVLIGSEGALQELLRLCQACWTSKDIPEQWRLASVVLLFKKGDASLPENYRPISLLPVGYKVVAKMLQKRLQQGGAEDRLRPTQFGFRPGRSTVQAISIVRRMFDAAHAAAGPGILALMLDWAKAFDRLLPEAMMKALKRFGVPHEMLQMIASIYRLRQFVLKDPCGDSTVRTQKAGIAQGCPLSPYLFILVQTVLLHDVDTRMREEGPRVQEPQYVVCEDVLYADDTLLVSSCSRKLQCKLGLVVTEGRKYGLELNWKKTILMQIGSTGEIKDPSGIPVKAVEQAVYLGGLLSSKATAKPEVTRRLGEARGVFKALEQVWSHANISCTRKVEVYHACVVSKLLYNLDSLWLLQADLHRLDAFHVHCLRCMYHIPCAYLSRISNADVLRTAHQERLSDVLHARQAKLYDRISAFPESHALRQLTCQPGSCRPREWSQKCRRGRPKQQWANSVYGMIQRHRGADAPL
jgi:hypothetical protein